MIKIGNGQGFWGDSPSAPIKLIRNVPDLDYLTLEYLAEVSLSIMAIQKQKNSDFGYARDFLNTLKELIPFWEAGRKFKIITNAGGLNPQSCARECMDILEQELTRPIKIGVVYGHDVMPIIDQSSNNLETGEPFDKIRDRVMTANAYSGTEGIVEALREGADIVITGRVADPSLTVAPCVAHFNWKRDDYDRLAAATVAGHLIECGAQVTGGIATDWMNIPDLNNIGYPFVEISEDGSFVVAKAPKTGGRIDEMTVKEQLVYEIGDPENYISPDVTVSFTDIAVKQEGPDRVSVSKIKGKPPTDSYKVNVTYRDGYKAEGTLVIFGIHAKEKVQRAGQVILDRLKADGYTYEETLIECLGMGDAVPGICTDTCQEAECVLRVVVKDSNPDSVERFSKEVASLVSSGPPGTTGYTTGRPPVREVFGFWPCLISKDKVAIEYDVTEVNG